MCGRFVVSKTSAELSGELQLENDCNAGLPSFNFAPTQSIPLIIEDSSMRLIDASWGLIPSWASNPPSAPLINARIETVMEKPSFKNSVRSHRGIVPATGYFEWMPNGSTKQPFFIHSEKLLLFAAIFEPPNSVSDKYSVSIMTKNSAPEIEQIHDRNPVMVEDMQSWLNPKMEFQELLVDISKQSDQVAKSLRFYEVNKAVGSVKNNHPGLISRESEQKLFE